MAQMANVLYDFDAEPGSGELTIRAGEQLTIVRTDVGDGWWEGRNEQGQQGLFPESYVETVVASAPPEMPPPPLPDNLPMSPSSHENGLQHTPQQPLAAQQSWGGQSADTDNRQSGAFDDDWDSDWDEEQRNHNDSGSKTKGGGSDKRHSRDPSTDGDSLSKSGGGGGGGGGGGPPPVVPPSPVANRTRHLSVNTSDDEKEESSSTPKAYGQLSVDSRQRGGSTGDISASRGTVKRNVNRWTNFVKSGTEAYILCTAKTTGTPSESHSVILTDEGAKWEHVSGDYVCTVEKPKKESKMHGLKSFIAYQLTPSFNNIQVSRRYKHFDWLHGRLSEKYVLVPIPPLPEKQVSGRYDDDLVEHRMLLLQIWVAKICRHPVLSRSETWLHFITCTDEKKWKVGKRKAEKDEFTGGNFFHSVTVPAQPIDSAEVETMVDSFGRMTVSLDNSVKVFHQTAGDSSKKMQGPYKREWQKMGNAFLQLGQSFELDQSTLGQRITNATKKASESYYAVAQMHEDQPKKDLDPLMDNLFAYKGMLAMVPDIVQVHKSAMQKLKDHEKLRGENKISDTEMNNIRDRVDRLSYSMLAEINHFQMERVVDFKDTMRQFLKAQIDFYQSITNQLQTALNGFENA